MMQRAARQIVAGVEADVRVDHDCPPRLYGVLEVRFGTSGYHPSGQGGKTSPRASLSH